MRHHRAVLSKFWNWERNDESSASVVPYMTLAG